MYEIKKSGQFGHYELFKDGICVLSPTTLRESDIKILKAIEATEAWIKQAEAKGAKETFEMGNDIGFSVLWCEKQNLKAYKEMLGQDKRKLRPELKQLYYAI